MLSAVIEPSARWRMMTHSYLLLIHGCEADAERLSRLFAGLTLVFGIGLGRAVGKHTQTTHSWKFNSRTRHIRLYRV